MLSGTGKHPPPAVTPRLSFMSVTEMLQKLAWHLASANALTAELSSIGFKSEIKVHRSPSGRVLLMIDRKW